MKRYIVEHSFISNRDGAICKAEHGITYETLKAAAQGQKDHIAISEYLCIGFRIIELQEVRDDV